MSATISKTKWATLRRRSVAWIYPLIDLVGKSMTIQYYCNFADPVQFRRKLPNVHSDILCKNWRTERGGEMVFYENLSILLYRYFVDEVHLSYRKPNLRVYDLL